MSPNSRLSATLRLSQVSILLLTAASAVASYVDPAGPAITAPPDPGLVYLRDDSQDVSFWGYVSESGTWDARFCAAGQSITLSGAYGACKSIAQATAAIATGCRSGSIVAYPSQSASCSAGNQCNTRVLHKDLDDKAGYSMYGCGVAASSSVDLFMKTTGSASRPTSTSTIKVSSSTSGVASSSSRAFSGSSASTSSSASSSTSSSSSRASVSNTLSSSSTISSIRATLASTGAVSKNNAPTSDSNKDNNAEQTSTTSKATSTSGTSNPITDSSSDNSNSSSKSSQSSAWIAGPAVGGAVGLAAIVGLAFWIIKRRQKKRQAAVATPSTLPVSTYPQYPSPPPPPMSASPIYQGNHPYQPPNNGYYGNNGYPDPGKFQELSTTTESPGPMELHGNSRPPEMQAPYYPQGR